MMIFTQSFLLGLLFSCVIIHVNSQTCKGPQNSPCSKNPHCSCMHLKQGNDTGVCGLASVNCSQLVPCAAVNSACYPGDVCVQVSQCGKAAVCYPLSLTQEHLCPPKPTVNGSLIDPSVQPQGVICANAKWNTTGVSITSGNQSNYTNYDTSGRRLTDFFIDKNGITYGINANHRTIMMWKDGKVINEISLNLQKSGNYTSLSSISYIGEVAFDNENTVYISDAYNRQILKWVLGTNSAELIFVKVHAMDIALDKRKNLYLCDYNNGTIFRLRNGGNEPEIVVSNLKYPKSVFVDRNDSIYVVELYPSQVSKYDQSGKKIWSLNETSLSFVRKSDWFPTDVFVDEAGAVYVVDQGGLVFRWLPNTKEPIVIVPDQRNGADYPNTLKILLDSEGNLYTLPANNNHVMRYAIDKSAC